MSYAVRPVRTPASCRRDAALGLAGVVLPNTHTHHGQRRCLYFTLSRPSFVPLVSCYLGLGRPAISLLSRSNFVALFQAIVAQVVPLFSRHPGSSLVVFISRHPDPGRPAIFAPSMASLVAFIPRYPRPAPSRYFTLILAQVVPLYSRHPGSSLVGFISRYRGPGRPLIFAPSRFQPCCLYFTPSRPRSFRYVRAISAQVVLYFCDIQVPASLPLFLRHPGPGRSAIFVLSWPRSFRYFRFIKAQPRCLRFTLYRPRSSLLFVCHPGPAALP